MTPDAWMVLAVLLVVFVALVRGLAAPSALLVGGLVALVVLGVQSPDRAFLGFSSTATITIAGLFVVARVIRDHLGLDRILDALLQNGRGGGRPALWRLLPPVALLSGVVNNTPVVATTAPLVHRWAWRHDIPASRLLVPLSFATILGGTLTTIGTSTSLVVSGALRAAGREPLGLLTVTPLGAPMVVVGLALIMLLAPRCLPDRPMVAPQAGDHVGRGRTNAPGGGTPRPAVGLHAPAARLVEAARGIDSGRLVRGTSLAILLCMVVLAATGLVPLVTAVLLACGLLILSGAISFSRAIESLDLEVLLVVAAAIGLGSAVERSGLAGVLSRQIAAAASGHGQLVGLALIVAATLLLTELITNVAAAALIVPIALDVADRVGGDPRGFAVAVALAASASFLTPIGYQTNTIVHGTGGYHFGDYWRLGLPLAAAVMLVTLLVVPLVWG